MPEPTRRVFCRADLLKHPADVSYVIVRFPKLVLLPQDVGFDNPKQHLDRVEICRVGLLLQGPRLSVRLAYAHKIINRVGLKISLAGVIDFRCWGGGGGGSWFWLSRPH